MILRNPLFGAYVAEHTQLLLIVPAALFMTAVVVRTNTTHWSTATSEMIAPTPTAHSGSPNILGPPHFQSAYKRTATKWQLLPARTSRCHTKWL